MERPSHASKNPPSPRQHALNSPTDSSEDPSFNDPTFFTVAFRLPIFYQGLFPTQSREPSYPENARAKVGIRSRMVERQGRFSLQSIAVEGVAHHENDVHILQIGFVGDKRAVTVHHPVKDFP